uniref:Uncharacterized protein n=1 Tax=Romanomermis culicivorax TaxID=13658 RepID=A0A915JFL4_ROMCU
MITLANLEPGNLSKENFANLMHQTFNEDAKKRTIGTFTTLLIANLLEKEQPNVQRKIYDCISWSINRKSYGKCVSTLLKRHREKLMGRRSKKRRKRSMETVQKKAGFTLTSQHIKISIFGGIGQMLYDFMHKVKLWITKLPEESSEDQNQINSRDNANKIKEFIESLLFSPLVGLKSHFDADQIDIDFKSVMDVKNDVSSPRILSPRVMPAVESIDQKIDLLSPDILSFYDDSKSPLSFSNLIQNASNADKKPWFQLFREVSGVNDVVRSMKSSAFLSKFMKKLKVNTRGFSLPLESAFEISEKVKVGDVYKLMSMEQLSDLNQAGYALMTNDQIDVIYWNRSGEVEHIRKMDIHEKEMLLIDQVEQFLHGSTSSRKKRANDPPCVNAPFIGGTSLITYLKSPQILCPAVFSYIILGPLVLSPYVLSPYILAPYILSPEVLTPIILSPYALSPNILSPAVLSPLVLSPYLLSPDILSPTVLSPTILSPNALSPLILSPGVLSPAVLSLNVLSPALLSPCVFC